MKMRMAVNWPLPGPLMPSFRPVVPAGSASIPGVTAARITVIRGCLLTRMAQNLAATRLSKPEEKRSSVSTEQQENLDAILRQSAFPPDITISEQRRLLKELISAQPLPADVTVTAASLGGGPAAEVTGGRVE